jgi:membrane associated rhomboid family serine protease
MHHHARMNTFALPSLSKMNAHKLTDGSSDDGASEDIEREVVSGVGGWSQYDMRSESPTKQSPHHIRPVISKFKLECRVRELSVQLTYLSQTFFLPWSIPLLSFIQIAIFYAAPNNGYGLAVRLPLIPSEEYKLITCILAHADVFHLWGNLVIQLVVGVIIETSEGTLRTQLIYWLSGLAASLSEAALFQPTVERSYIILLGASGAIYALLLIALSSTLMNFKETRGAWCIVLLYLVMIGVETYVSAQSSATNIAFAAHATGALYGLVLGFIFVRNMHVTQCEYSITLLSTVYIVVFSTWLLFVGFSNYDKGA